MKPPVIAVQYLIAVMCWACPAAWADVVVVMNAKSPITALNREQVIDLYLCRSHTYPGGSPAVTTLLGEAPIKDEFFLKVLGKSDSEVRSVWARMTFTGRGVAPRELRSAAQLKQVLAGDPRAIGFIDRSTLDERVKVVYAP